MAASMYRQADFVASGTLNPLARFAATAAVVHQPPFSWVIELPLTGQRATRAVRVCRTLVWALDMQELPMSVENVNHDGFILFRLRYNEVCVERRMPALNEHPLWPESLDGPRHLLEVLDAVHLDRLEPGILENELRFRNVGREHSGQF